MIVQKDLFYSLVWISLSSLGRCPLLVSMCCQISVILLFHYAVAVVTYDPLLKRPVGLFSRVVGQMLQTGNKGTCVKAPRRHFQHSFLQGHRCCFSLYFVFGFLLKDSLLLRFYFHFLVFPSVIHSSGFRESSPGDIFVFVLSSTHRRTAAFFLWSSTSAFVNSI